MGYSLFHLATMNCRRGSLRQAEELFMRARDTSEHMGSNLVDILHLKKENKFMVAITHECLAEVYARDCKPDKAERAYSSARALLENIEGKEGIATHRWLDIQVQNIPDKCKVKVEVKNVEIQRDVNFHFLNSTLFIACVILCSIYIYRWRRRHGGRL
jgi:hypothetical protein